jgi:hypothetical protein
MGADVRIRRLIRFETAADGNSIKVLVEDAVGETGAVSFPIDCLTSLIMTLPGMVTSAIQRRGNDPTLRVTFPLKEFEVERSVDPEVRILTLTTLDGYSVSFSLNEVQYKELANDAMLEQTRLN